MPIFSRIASLASACSLTVALSAAHAQGSTYPASWDTSQAGSPLPASATAGSMTFDDEFTTLSVCADGVSSCNWYAPIRSSLGTGTLAQPNNSQAINLSTNALTLNTINPSSSGVGGTDVFMQSIDTHGHGYSMTNGYVEAGISLPAAYGSHAGFWMDEIQTSQGHGEIDFPETYGAKDTTFTSNVHWWPVGEPEQSPPHRQLLDAGSAPIRIMALLWSATYDYDDLHLHGSQGNRLHPAYPADVKPLVFRANSVYRRQPSGRLPASADAGGACSGLGDKLMEVR